MDIQGNYEIGDDKGPNCYCKHGRFIGNPYGADYMCGACENGDPDITIEDIKIQRAIFCERGLNAIKALNTADLPLEEVVKAVQAKCAEYAAQIAEIEQWATSDTDENWMQRRQDKREEQYYQDLHS